MFGVSTGFVSNKPFFPQNNLKVNIFAHENLYMGRSSGLENHLGMTGYHILYKKLYFWYLMKHNFNTQSQSHPHLTQEKNSSTWI